MWAVGKKELPPAVISLGGRFGYDDDGQTPNTQISFFDYKPAPVIFEVRGLPKDKNSTGAMDNYLGIRIGNVIRCENGYFAGGRGGGWIYDNDGKRIKQFVGDGGEMHMANFIDAVRSRNADDLNSDVLKGHLSAAICHMANISYRLGQRTSPEKVRQFIEDMQQEPFLDSWQRMQQHLSLNEVDLSKAGVNLGPRLQFNPQTERFIGEGEYGLSRFANEMLRRKYRKPFVVPEKV
ncbi:MAG: hypothetical protein ACYSSP_01980 [Planctomycetota bacterium]